MEKRDPQSSRRRRSTRGGAPKSSHPMSSRTSPAYARLRARVSGGNRKNETAFETIRHSLWSTDWMTLVMLAIYTLLDIIFITVAPQSLGVLQGNILVAVAIVACTVWYDQTGSRI